MLGEVVVVLDPGAGPGVDDVRKPSMQLASKMRFISAQFDALFRSAPTCGCAARPTPTRWRAGVLLAGAPGVIVPASPAAQHLGRGDG